MKKPHYIATPNTPEEADLLKAAYAHDHEPIPFRQHQAVQEELSFQSLMRSQHSGWFVDLQMVDGHPNRFFLSGRRADEYQPSMATKGFWHKNAPAREHMAEFAKALAAMLVILAPMLLPGGGL